MTMNSITPKDLKVWMDQSVDFQLIDVREPWEREVGLIEGSGSGSYFISSAT